MTSVDVLVEGLLDAEVARKLLLHCELSPGTVYGQRGWSYIQQKVDGFASSQSPLFALVDFMDTGAPCAGEIVSTWLTGQYANCVFRVVNREIESWLLADRESMAKFLHVPASKITLQPDNVHDPKLELTNLARRSRSSAIRNGFIPRQGVSASEGPTYTASLTDYCANLWRPEVAAENSPSLAKCITRLLEMRARLLGK